MSTASFARCFFRLLLFVRFSRGSWGEREPMILSISRCRCCVGAQRSFRCTNSLLGSAQGCSSFVLCSVRQWCGKYFSFIVGDRIGSRKQWEEKHFYKLNSSTWAKSITPVEYDFCQRDTVVMRPRVAAPMIFEYWLSRLGPTFEFETKAMRNNYCLLHPRRKWISFSDEWKMNHSGNKQQTQANQIRSSESGELKIPKKYWNNKAIEMLWLIKQSDCLWWNKSNQLNKSFVFANE